MSTLTWTIRSYEELTKDELFDMCEVRQEVFVWSKTVLTKIVIRRIKNLII